MLRSDLYGYSGVYIVVKGRITVDATDDANERNKSCISKINNIGGLLLR